MFVFVAFTQNTMPMIIITKYTVMEVLKYGITFFFFD